MTSTDPKSCGEVHTDERAIRFLDRPRVAAVGTSSAIRSALRLFEALGAELVALEFPEVESGEFLPGGMRESSNTFPVPLDEFVKKVATLDVVLCEWDPMRGASIPRDFWREVRCRLPETIVVTISPFGLTGPYSVRPASEAIIAAFTGLAHLTPRDIPLYGDGHDQPPLAMPPGLIANYAAISAVAGALSALYRRNTSGRGEEVEIAMSECLIPTLRREVAMYAMEGAIPSRFMRVWQLAPWGVKRCRDGYIFVQVVEEHHWRSLVEMMDCPDWACDPALNDSTARYSRREVVDRGVEEWLAVQERDVVVTDAQLRGLPFSPVSQPKDLAALPQIRHRKFLERNAGTWQMGLPFLVKGCAISGAEVVLS